MSWIRADFVRSQSSTGWLIPSLKPNGSMSPMSFVGKHVNVANAGLPELVLQLLFPFVQPVGRDGIEQHQHVRQLAGAAPEPPLLIVRRDVAEPARPARLGHSGLEFVRELRQGVRRTAQSLEPFVGECDLQRGVRPAALDGGRHRRLRQPGTRGRGIRDGQQMKAGGLEMLVTEAHQPLDVAIIVVGQLHRPASHKSHSHARTSVSVIVRRSKPARTRALRSRS